MRTALKILAWSTSLVAATVALATGAELLRRESAPEAPSVARAEPEPPSPEVREPPPPIELPPVVILTKAPSRSSPARVSRARSLDEMRCSGWRPLAMGSGSVRVCE